MEEPPRALDQEASYQPSHSSMLFRLQSTLSNSALGMATQFQEQTQSQEQQELTASPKLNVKNPGQTSYPGADTKWEKVIPSGSEGGTGESIPATPIRMKQQTLFGKNVDPEATLPPRSNRGRPRGSRGGQVRVRRSSAPTPDSAAGGKRKAVEQQENEVEKIR